MEPLPHLLGMLAVVPGIDRSTRSGLAFRQYWKSQGAIRGSADR